MEKSKRTLSQNKSIHLGCQQIADIMIENNITINMLIKEIEVRPTMESVKAIFRAMAEEKYLVKSTADLERQQIDPIWEELVHAVSKITGETIPFPSRENTDDYWKYYK